MSDDPQSTTKYVDVVTQWQIILSTQMHFNDMILRTRAIGSSVVVAAYGAAAISLGQYPDEFLFVWGYEMHISVFIICFALSLLLSIFFMDVTYYYRLLLGVVEVGAKLEDENASLIGTTKQLSKKVSLGWANFVVFVFYAIPTAIGGFFLIYVLKYCPSAC